jgi:transcriptional regulator with XRE-family HTH domain
MSEPYEFDLEAYRLAFVATEAVQRGIDLAGLSRAAIAERLGVSRPRVSQVLDGSSNMTLRTLAELGLACGVRWELVGVDAADSSRIVISTNKVAVPVPPITHSSSPEVLLSWAGVKHPELETTTSEGSVLVSLAGLTGWSSTVKQSRKQAHAEKQALPQEDLAA